MDPIHTQCASLSVLDPVPPSTEHSPLRVNRTPKDAVMAALCGEDAPGFTSISTINTEAQISPRPVPWGRHCDVPRSGISGCLPGNGDITR